MRGAVAGRGGFQRSEVRSRIRVVLAFGAVRCRISLSKGTRGLSLAILLDSKLSLNGLGVTWQANRSYSIVIARCRKPARVALRRCRSHGIRRCAARSPSSASSCRRCRLTPRIRSRPPISRRRHVMRGPKVRPRHRHQRRLFALRTFPLGRTSPKMWGRQCPPRLRRCRRISLRASGRTVLLSALAASKIPKVPKISALPTNSLPTSPVSRKLGRLPSSAMRTSSRCTTSRSKIPWRTSSWSTWKGRRSSGSCASTTATSRSTWWRTSSRASRTHSRSRIPTTCCISTSSPQTC